jgi:type 1 fimbria pilin
MKPSIKRLSQGLVLAACCQSPLALAGCYWAIGSGMSIYQRSIGTLYVPRDARVGTVIGNVDMSHFTPNTQGNRVACWSEDFNERMTFNARGTAPLFTGPLDPINGEDVTGKIFQTNIRGIGVRIKLDFPFDGSSTNSFIPIGPPTVPFDGWYSRHPNDPVTFTVQSLENKVTLVKTGPLDPGVHTLDGGELFSGHFSDLGKAMSYGIIGTIIQAQCSVSGNPVSADPVQLGDWDTSDFTGPGYTTTAVPFSITLSACETDPGGGSIATANIQLEGVKGSAPIGPTTNGVFSLTSDSGAQGLGIQLLKADGVTPMELGTEVPLIAISPGTTVLDFNARFYQTGASSAIRPGLAKGALSFTVTYK